MIAAEDDDQLVLLVVNERRVAARRRLDTERVDGVVPQDVLGGFERRDGGAVLGFLEQRRGPVQRLHRCAGRGEHVLQLCVGPARAGDPRGHRLCADILGQRGRRLGQRGCPLPARIREELRQVLGRSAEAARSKGTLCAALISAQKASMAAGASIE